MPGARAHLPDGASAPAEATPPADAIEVARLGEPWGVKGWVKVLAYSEDATALFKVRPWWVTLPTAARGRAPAAAPSACVVFDAVKIKPHAGGLVAHLAGVDDRDAALALRGAEVWLSRAQFPPTGDPDEFYWVDLIGMRVRNREGLELGLVSRIVPTGPHVVLVLDGEGGEPGQERMIPFVSVYVDGVDQAERCIRVDWQPDY